MRDKGNMNAASEIRNELNNIEKANFPHWYSYIPTIFSFTKSSLRLKAMKAIMADVSAAIKLSIDIEQRAAVDDNDQYVVNLLSSLNRIVASIEETPWRKIASVTEQKKTSAPSLWEEFSKHLNEFVTPVQALVQKKHAEVQQEVGNWSEKKQSLEKEHQALHETLVELNKQEKKLNALLLQHQQSQQLLGKVKRLLFLSQHATKENFGPDHWVNSSTCSMSGYRRHDVCSCCGWQQTVIGSVPDPEAREQALNKMKQLESSTEYRQAIVDLPPLSELQEQLAQIKKKIEGVQVNLFCVGRNLRSGDRSKSVSSLSSFLQAFVEFFGKSRSSGQKSKKIDRVIAEIPAASAPCESSVRNVSQTLLPVYQSSISGDDHVEVSQTPPPAYQLRVGGANSAPVSVFGHATTFQPIRTLLDSPTPPPEYTSRSNSAFGQG